MVRDIVRSGVLGKISRIAITWNYNGPRWHNDRPDVWAALKEEDTDWKRWLLNKPYRPFNKGEYLEYRIHKELSSGIPDQWMSHIVDIIQYTMDEDFPRSATADGGIFVWKEARQSPDTFQASFTYPKEFMFSYSTTFGNEFPQQFRIYGTNGTINLAGQNWTISGEGGKFRHKENTDQIQGVKPIEFKEEFAVETVDRSSASQPWPGHMKNWIECIRSRKQPNATVWNGYCMTVSVLMSVAALDEGKKMYWDPIKHQIQDTPPSV
jgi:predicted dehydrogenase